MKALAMLPTWLLAVVLVAFLGVVGLGFRLAIHDTHPAQMQHGTYRVIAPLLAADKVASPAPTSAPISLLVSPASPSATAILATATATRTRVPTLELATAPPGPRTGAVCRDGTSSRATGSGACSGHGGVSYWTY